MAAGEQPCEPGQYRPIGRLECWSVDLASWHCHLVSQHDDLDGEIGVAAAQEPDQLQDAAERPVKNREDHRRMVIRFDAGCQSAGRRLRTGFSAPTGR